MKKLSLFVVMSMLSACTNIPQDDHAQELTQLCKVHEGKVKVVSGQIQCQLPAPINKTLNQSELEQFAKEVSDIMIKGDSLPKGHFGDLGN